MAAKKREKTQNRKLRIGPVVGLALSGRLRVNGPDEDGLCS